MKTEKLNVEEIENRLINLGVRIDRENPGDLRHPGQENLPEWLGADVCVTSDYEAENDPDSFDHDLIVRTRHAKELSWMFMELRDAFDGWLDYRNKYGFYAALGRAALGHLAANQPELNDPTPLLKAVLAEAFVWLGTLKESGGIPSNPGIVIHQTDAEGQQRRITPEDLL